MWNPILQDYLQLFYKSRITYESPVFRKKLKATNLENKTIRVKYYHDVEIITDEIKNIRFYIKPVAESEKPDWRDTSANENDFFDNWFMDVDEAVYYSALKELKTVGLEKEVDYISCILKVGYYFQIISIILGDSEFNTKYINELITLHKAIIEQKTVKGLKIEIKDRENINIFHPLLLESITSLIASSFEKMHVLGLYDFIEYSEKKELDRKVELQEFYRDVTLCTLIYYLIKEPQYIKLNNGKLTISNKEFELLYNLLEAGKIVDDTGKMSDKKNIARNWYKRFVGRFPQVKEPYLNL